MNNYYKRSSIQQSSEICLYIFLLAVFIGFVAVASYVSVEIFNGAKLLINVVTGGM